MKALVVEDDAIASMFLKATLDRCNCACDIANSGVEAMLLYFKHDYNLIFMDLGLPDINGITLTWLMRNHNKWNKHTPIIAITAHEDEELIISFLNAGANLYLPKPVEQNQINAVVARFFHK